MKQKSEWKNANFTDLSFLLQLESRLPRPEILSGYQSLLDGHIIHAVFLQINPEPNHHLSRISDEEGIFLPNARSRNFDAIVKNLKGLYDEEFGQTVLRLPDCYVLGHNPGMLKAKHKRICISLTLFF